MKLRMEMYRASPSSSSTTTSSLALLECLKERAFHFAEMLKDRLYFGTVSEVNLHFFLKKSDSNLCFVHFDKELLYQPFNHDFGPLNVAMLYRFCKKINSHLHRNKTIVHLTTTNRFKRVNAAYLVGSYCIIYHHLLPGDVISRLKELSISYVAYKTFTPFVDAGFDTSEYYLHLEDCFNAVHKASMKQILNFEKFNLNEYLFYERVENGDLNWIIPGRFIAFCDPQTYSDSSNHFIKLYINYFRKHNITTIIRLNKSRYDSKLFTDKGFKHYNLVFMDGGVPSDQILNEFLRIAETHQGAIAVHCKAGLGRTGTLIACYLIKHYQFTALEAIAWVRICRPGSIVGYQQKWLTIKQNSLWMNNNNNNNQMDLSTTITGHVVDEEMVIETTPTSTTNTTAANTPGTAEEDIDDEVEELMMVDNHNNNDLLTNNPEEHLQRHSPPITIVKCHILNQQDGRSSPTTTMIIHHHHPLNHNHPPPQAQQQIIETHQTYQVPERQQSPVPGECTHNQQRQRKQSKLLQLQNSNKQLDNVHFKDKDTNNNDDNNETQTMTQGDYLNQIKLNRNKQQQTAQQQRKHLRPSRIINHWWFNNSHHSHKSNNNNLVMDQQPDLNNNNNNNETETDTSDWNNKTTNGQTTKSPTKKSSSTMVTKSQYGRRKKMQPILYSTPTQTTQTTT